MIRYALRCPEGHAFDSWFRSADDFDRLAAAGLVACATCGAGGVAKAVMAPAVATPAPPQAPEPSPLEKLRAHVEAHSTWVGLRFAAEARAMHAGDQPLRPIHGQARPEEAKALIEEGVPIAPLPFVPKETAN